MAEDVKNPEVKPEENPNGNPDNKGENQNGQQPTLEELVVQLKQAQAENLRNKNSMDKVMSENNKLKEQLRQKMSAEEQTAQAEKEKAEAQQNYVKELEKKLAKIEATNRYISMGMDASLADATADAELGGDQMTVTSNIKKMTDALLKAKEAEWLKTRPAPQTGGDGSVTKEQFDKMTLMQKSELFERDPETYHRLLGR